MGKRILSATVSIGEKTKNMTFSPGINILCGQNAEDVVLTLAGIFFGIPPKPFEAVLNWEDGVTLFVSGADGRVFVNNIKKERGNSAQMIKAFHKYRFLNFRNKTHVFDGSQLPAGTSGASDLLLQKLEDTLKQKDDCPLFICNFLERLDEAVALQPILEALTATGRQILIAVPHCYNITALEKMPHDTTSHAL